MEIASGTFWVRKEINDQLAAYAKEHNWEGIQIKFKHRGDAEYACVYGQKLEGAPRFSDDVEHKNFEIHTEIWADQTISRDIVDELQHKVSAYIDMCHLDDYWLPMYTEDTLAICEATVQRFIGDNYFVAVFMLDLDHFKQVNDKYDHDTGSQVLREFCELTQEVCADKAILIHRSGDELFVIMPYENTAEPLALAYEIRKATKEHHFADVASIELTAAQGICLITDHSISFQNATRQAEEAYNPHDKNNEKKRDSVRIANCGKPVERGRTNCDLAFSIVKTGGGREDIFQNPYLDFISNAVAQVKDIADVQPELEGMIEWISPNQAAGMLMVNWPATCSCECAWSTEELAFAVLYGLSRNYYVSAGKNLQLSICADGSNFRISLGEQQLCYYPGNEFLEEGSRNYQIESVAEETTLHETRTVVAVVIGYADMPIPETCFYKVIRIDARATRGGSLPDFWEAALSEVIELFHWHPFLGHIIVYGKREYGERFCEILEKCSEWGNDPYSFEFLSKKTRQSVERIQNCKARIENQYKLCEEGDQQGLVSSLKHFYEEDTWSEYELPGNPICSRRFLERRLSYEKIELGIEDGCKVETMDEAFPTVLDIIRTGVSDIPYGRIKDQAGRELKELPNFKVVITKPDSRHVPEYYWEQKDELEQYYQRTFGTKEAFFMKHLQENNQYESVIKHIAKLITPEGLEYATRRAILVVPHKVEDANDIAPLGLVSVCIAPRRQGDMTVLDFSYTWRTVEAVVGFPYSLYGSIKFAEAILKNVQEQIGEGDNAQWLKMGAVAYLAYSFHMFLDEDSSRIVRGIVNDASM